MAGKSAEAAAGTVQSRPFQFAEVEYVRGTTLRDGSISWNEGPVPRRFERIRNRWIYAFQVDENRYSEQKPLLAAEYLADHNCELAHVPGKIRRHFGPKAPEVAPKPVPAATLPIVVQGRRLHYFFVATRARLSTDAIAMIENAVGDTSYFFARRDLTHDLHLSDNPMSPCFVRIADPLTSAEYHHRAYAQALNDYIRSTCPVQGDANAAKVAVRNRKYHLARILRDSFIRPKGGAEDPLGLKKHLRDQGRPLFEFLKEYETSHNDLEERRAYCANALVGFLDSSLWRACQLWYRSDLSEYHFYLESAARCHERLSETTVGARYLRKVILERYTFNLADELIAPMPKASDKAERFYKGLYGPVRKTTTGVFLAIAEFGPALVLYRNDTALERIQATLEACLQKSEAAIGRRSRPKRVLAQLGVRKTTPGLRISKKKTKIDLKEWLEEGKPHWPSGTHEAELSELWGKLMWAVEIINLYNVFHHFAEKRDKEWTDYLEPPGAVLDLWIAFEDQIRETVHKASGHGAGHAPAHGKIAASVGEHAESIADGAAHGVARAEGEALEAVDSAKGAHALVEEEHDLAKRLVSPKAFKFLGAISALIDVFVNIEEARSAQEKGETDLATAHKVVAGGAGMIVVGSLLALPAYAPEAAFAAMLATSLLFVGALVFAAGLFAAFLFERSAFQTFARYSIFGVDPKHEGTANWLEGNFRDWKETVPGIESQIRHLMALLCQFKAYGTGYDSNIINIEFGCLPPAAEMECEFTIKYENGHELRPRYTVDLGKSVLKESTMPPSAYRLLKDDHGRPTFLQIGAHRPSELTRLRVIEAVCELRLLYGESDSLPHHDEASEHTSEASEPVNAPTPEHEATNSKGTGGEGHEESGEARAGIPAWGSMRYELLMNGSAQRAPLKSTDASPEEEKATDLRANVVVDGKWHGSGRFGGRPPPSR